MKTKGLTLIELLAVIVILGVIMVIAVPVINTIVADSAQKAFYESENRMEKAAEIYRTNTGLSFVNVAVGGTQEITYIQLITGGYLEKIYDPISNAECTDSKVVATKQSDGTIIYIADIICENYSSN